MISTFGVQNFESNPIQSKKIVKVGRIATYNR